MLGMNNTKMILTGCAALALMAAPAAMTAARADSTTPTPLAAPAAAPHAGHGGRTAGTVSAVDAAANTVTVTTREGDSVVATTSPKTRVMTMTLESVNDLKVGDVVEVGTGKEGDASATTVTASRIVVLPMLPRKEEARKHAVVGTIATVTPGLTLTTDDGSTVAVTTAARTKVYATTPSTFSAITVGDRVEIRGRAAGTGSVTARMIIIAPAKG